MIGDEAMAAWDKANSALKAGDLDKAEELAKSCAMSDARLMREKISIARIAKGSA